MRFLKTWGGLAALLGVCVLSLTTVHATIMYNKVVTVSTINLRATWSGEKVVLKWNSYVPTGFDYYKVIRSTTNATPTYPEDGFIKYSTDTNFTTTIDAEVPYGKVYYRICVIAGQNRYCSNVVSVQHDRAATSVLEQTTNLALWGFLDTADHWARAYIKELKDDGVVMGKDNLYYPDRFVSRAEWLKMALRTAYGNIPPASGQGNIFTDVPADAWYLPYVEFASGLNIIEGPLFRPNDYITRGEAIVIAIKALGYLQPETTSTIFTDISDPLLIPFVEKARTMGIIKGYSTYQFAPLSKLTRGEAAKVLILMKRQKNINGDACSENYEPVCGTLAGEAQTFANQCIATRNEATNITLGVCPITNTDPYGNMKIELRGAMSDRGIQLTWTTDNINTGYKVLRSDTNRYPVYPTTGSDMAALVNDNTTKNYADDTVEAGKTYYYRVCAYLPGQGCLTYSNNFTMTVPADFTRGSSTTDDLTIYNLKAIFEEGKIHLTWSANMNGAYGFKVLRSINHAEPTYPPLEGDEAAYLGSTIQRSYYEDKFEYNTTYFYRVCIFYNDQCLAYSNVDEVQTGQPVGDTRKAELTAKVYYDRVELSWTLNNLTPSYGFKILRSFTNMNPTYPPLTGDKAFDVPNQNSRSYTDTTFDNRKSYFYRLCVLNSLGTCEPYSNNVKIQYSIP